MYIDKVIELLSDYCDRGIVTLGDDFRDATRVGKSAVIAITLLRAGTPGLNLSLLPGETERKDNE